MTVRASSALAHGVFAQTLLTLFSPPRRAWGLRPALGLAIRCAGSVLSHARLNRTNRAGWERKSLNVNGFHRPAGVGAVRMGGYPPFKSCLGQGVAVTAGASKNERGSGGGALSAAPRPPRGEVRA